MIIHEIHDLSNRYVNDLMRTSYSEITSAAMANYHPDYSEQPGNIFRILEEGRYAPGFGKYYVIEIDGQLAASAGWNKYELQPDVALLLTRMYVSPSYRAQYLLGLTVLPTMVEEAKEFEKRWITVNEYNKTIYKWFERAHAGLRPTMGNDWPDIYKNFKPIGKRQVYFTDQWVVEYK